MRIVFRQAARDDVIRQVRYYLVEQDVPQVAIRFRAAVQQTVRMILKNPQAAARVLLRNANLPELRSWAITGFPAVRVYYLLDADTVHVVRVLHGKRDIRTILEREMRG